MFIMKCLFIFGGWFKYTSSVDRSIGRRWLLSRGTIYIASTGALGIILSSISVCTIDRLVTHLGSLGGVSRISRLFPRYFPSLSVESWYDGGVGSTLETVAGCHVCVVWLYMVTSWPC